MRFPQVMNLYTATKTIDEMGSIVWQVSTEFTVEKCLKEPTRPNAFAQKQSQAEDLKYGQQREQLGTLWTPFSVQFGSWDEVSFPFEEGEPRWVVVGDPKIWENFTLSRTKYRVCDIRLIGGHLGPKS